MRQWLAAATCALLVAPLTHWSAPAEAATVTGGQPTAATAPSPWVSCRVTLAGVPVKMRASERTRTIVDGLGGKRAQLSFWVRNDSPCGFVQVFTTKAWVGANGLADGR